MSFNLKNKRFFVRKFTSGYLQRILSSQKQKNCEKVWIFASWREFVWISFVNSREKKIELYYDLKKIIFTRSLVAPWNNLINLVLPLTNIVHFIIYVWIFGFSFCLVIYV
jgi:hypothetical protein